MRLRAMFCVDPGGSTGVAWSIVNLDAKTIAEAMATRAVRGSETVKSTSELVQARAIAELYQDFVSALEGEPLEVVIEEWLPHGKRSREGSSPARIAWAFIGYVDGKYGTGIGASLHWVQPTAQRHATQQRLKPAEAWVVGREHERAAYALMIERLHRTMGIH